MVKMEVKVMVVVVVLLFDEDGEEMEMVGRERRSEWLAGVGRGRRRRGCLGGEDEGRERELMSV